MRATHTLKQLCENQLKISATSNPRHINLLNNIKDNHLKSNLLNFLCPIPHQDPDIRLEKWGTHEDIQEPSLIVSKSDCLIISFKTHRPPIFALKNALHREGSFQELRFSLEFSDFETRYLGYEVLSVDERYGNAFYLGDGLNIRRDTHLSNSPYLTESLQLMSVGIDRTL